MTGPRWRLQGWAGCSAQGVLFRDLQSPQVGTSHKWVKDQDGAAPTHLRQRQLAGRVT